MPAAIGYAIGYVTVALGGSIATGIAIASALGTLATTVLLNVGLGLVSKALGPKSSSGNRAAINVTIRSATASRSVVLGSTRVGGVVVFYRCSGSNNKYLHYVIAYAGHQCNAIKDVYLDTIKVLHANIDAGTGAVTQTPYTGKLNIWRYTGTSSQSADATLVSAFSGVWTSAFQLKGICYAHIRMERDGTAYPQGPPQSVSAIVEGAKLYDPRLDSTNGGSGSHRYTDATTWAYSTNPALALRWILTGGSVTNDVSTPQVKYGVKDSNSRLADAYTIAAANICDEALTGAYTTPAGDQVRYWVGIELSCGLSLREWTEGILACMAGVCFYVNGKWRIHAGAYDSPIHSITDADVYGDIEIQDTSSHEDRYNAVGAVFRDSELGFIEQPIEFRTDTDYETQDGGERLPKELDLPGVTNDALAQRLCEIEKRKSRLMRTVKIVGSLNLLKVAPWETFTYSNAKYWAEGRVFRCIERQFNFAEEAGRVEVTARVESPSVYTDMVTADYTSPNTHTPVYNIELPDAATSLTATSVPNGIRFTVGLPAYLDPNTVVQLFGYTSSTPFSSATLVAEFRASEFTLSELTTTTRYYWVRMLNKSTQQVSVEYPTSSAGVAGTARLIQTDDIELEAISTFGITAYDGGGTTRATKEITTRVNFTPDHDCEILVDAQLDGYSQFDGDSGSSLRVILCETADITSGPDRVESADIIDANTGNVQAGVRTGMALKFVTSVTNGVAYTAAIRGQYGVGASGWKVWTSTVIVHEVKR